MKTSEENSTSNNLSNKVEEIAKNVSNSRPSVAKWKAEQKEREKEYINSFPELQLNISYWNDYLNKHSWINFGGDTRDIDIDYTKNLPALLSYVEHLNMLGDFSAAVRFIAGDLFTDVVLEVNYEDCGGQKLFKIPNNFKKIDGWFTSPKNNLVTVSINKKTSNVQFTIDVDKAGVLDLYLKHNSLQFDGYYNLNLFLLYVEFFKMLKAK